MEPLSTFFSFGFELLEAASDGTGLKGLWAQSFDFVGEDPLNWVKVDGTLIRKKRPKKRKTGN